MSTNPDPNFFRVDQPDGAPMLCLGERPMHPMPCGCVPYLKDRRCVTARKLRVLKNNADSDKLRHALTVALNEHLNGR